MHASFSTMHSTSIPCGSGLLSFCIITTTYFVGAAATATTILTAIAAVSPPLLARTSPSLSRSFPLPVPGLLLPPVKQLVHLFPPLRFGCTQSQTTFGRKTALSTDGFGNAAPRRRKRWGTGQEGERMRRGKKQCLMTIKSNDLSQVWRCREERIQQEKKEEEEGDRAGWSEGRRGRGNTHQGPGPARSATPF